MARRGRGSRDRRERLDALDPETKRTLYKRAARMRKAAREELRGRPRRRDWAAELDDGSGEAHEGDQSGASRDDRKGVGLGPPVERMARRKRDTIGDWVDRLLDEDLPADRGSESAPEDASEATVVGVMQGRCAVEWHGQPAGRASCRLRPELAMWQRSELAVGDRVLVSKRDDGEFWVEQVLARTSVLSRPDPGPGEAVERVIAANVDLVVAIAAIQDPPLRLGLLDRTLIAAERGGAETLIVINKLDLVSPDLETTPSLELLAPYRALGVTVLAVSAECGWGVDALRSEIAAKTCVFVGKSGVGKSSLLNALDPTLGLAARDVGAAGKGRHTTTASALYQLENGARVIDTPGVREFGLWQVTADDVQAYFHEFDDFATSCRFADCSHLHEPDCEVRDAVSRGEIAEARYGSYERMLRTL